MKRGTIVILVIVAGVLCCVAWHWFALDQKQEKELQQRLGIAYPIYKNDPNLLEQLIKEGLSVKENPLIFYAIEQTRPKRSDREWTLEEMQEWDQRACAMVKILIENGANVDLPGGIMDGTPLAYAAYWNLSGVVELLLKAGANPNLSTEYGGGPLLNSFALSSTWDNSKIVKMLLDHGANPNSVDQYKNTPLHDSIRHGVDVLIVKYLLEAGADPTMKNKDGQTPLDIEKSYSEPNQQIIELLEVDGKK